MNPIHNLVAWLMADAVGQIKTAIAESEKHIMSKLTALATTLQSVATTLESVDALVIALADADLTADQQAALDKVVADAAKLQADAGNTPAKP